MTAGHPSPGPASQPAAGVRPAALAAFGSRTLFAGLTTAGFAALAWADWTGLGGAQPAWWLLPMAVALAVGGTNEMVQLFAARRIMLPAWLLGPAVVAVVLAAAAGAGAFAATSPAVSPVTAMGWSAITIVFAIIAVCLLEIATYVPHGSAIERLTAGAFTIVFLGLPFACIVSLRLLCLQNIGPQQTGSGHMGAHLGGQLGMLPLVSLVAVAKAGDIAAYLGGTLMGRHRMTPALSPGKTWEGAVASLAGSSAAAWIVLKGFADTATAGPWGGWLVFGIGVGLAAMVGDLAESLLKRECGVKDSGRSLGGLGGVLDLVDSLLFAAPVAWLLWVFGRV